MAYHNFYMEDFTMLNFLFEEYLFDVEWRR